MKTLKISKEISLPIDAVTQTMAELGRKGSGKTYLASMIAEQMLDAKAQVIVIDPVGNWYGLRIGADGRSKGKEIFVIGGEHGDVPLVPEAGKRIAKLLVEKNISAVLDVSGFRIGEHKRFAADFAEEFFHLKKSSKTPVHIFIEEAQKLIPQRVGTDEARMVGAFEQIVRLGRNYGIGCSLISQRPQSVNKEVLSQVECLCVLQMTGPHERKALDEWVQEAGADRTLVNELPGLAQGEGYIWSPGWLRVYKRVHFSKKETFDTSATPEVGKETQTAKISSVDVESLKTDMQDIVTQVEKDNPVILRKKIRELEEELKKGIAGGNKKTNQEVIFHQKSYDDGCKATEIAWRKEADRIRNEDLKEILRLKKVLEQIFKLANPEYSILSNIITPKIRGVDMKPNEIIPRIYDDTENATPIRQARDRFDSEDTKTSLRAGAMKMLNWLSSVDGSLSKQRLATLSGFAVTGGTFLTYISELKRMGWIQGDNDLSITALGRSYAETIDIPTGEELLNLWRGKFRLGAGKILRFLYDSYPSETTKEDIGASTGFEASGGTFLTYISELRRNGLIEVSGGGIKISEEFFN